MHHVPVIVLDDDPALRDRLTSQLGGRAAAAESLEAADSRLDGDGPAVLLVGPSLSSAAGLAEIGRLRQAHRHLGAILVSEELTTELLHMAIRAGINDVLALPVSTKQLVAAVAGVAENLDGAREAHAPHSAAVGSGSHGSGLGEVTTVFSTKGGAGKSVVAANLAVSLARRKPDKPVVLVDADLQFGDVAVMLKLAPQHTIVDVVGSLDRLDAALLQQLLMRHDPSGLLVLPAPLEPSFADQVSAGEMVEIIGLLRTFCSHVVIDTPAYFNEVVLGVIEESDSVLMVAGMDIPNIKNVKIGLQTMLMLNMPASKLHLILNRADSKVQLDVGEVEKTLQIKADCLIPSDIVVPQSVNKGVPVVMDAPRSGVAKSIEQLADLLVAVPGAIRRR